MLYSVLEVLQTRHSDAAVCGFQLCQGAAGACADGKKCRSHQHLSFRILSSQSGKVPFGFHAFLWLSLKVVLQCFGLRVCATRSMTASISINCEPHATWNPRFWERLWLCTVGS